VNNYYDLVRQYLGLRAQGLSASEIEANMTGDGNASEQVRQICEDMANPDAVFAHIRLPECPHCATCNLEEYCVTRLQLGMARSLYPIMKRNMPRQGLFDDSDHLLMDVSQRL
jgi:hypothetical protein